MTLKTARTKSRLTDTESAADLARRGGVEAANEAGARGDAAGGRKDRSISGAAVGGVDVRSAVKEGGAMPYRDPVADSTIGNELTRAREVAGLRLDDVAAQLRIRREFLAALEEGRPDALPGLTYAIGYVRTYAAFLGLDVESAVTRFKQEAAGLAQQTQLVFPSPAPEGRVPGVSLVFASVVLVGLAFGGWYWMSERGVSVYDMVPELPERLATLIEGQTGALTAPQSTAPVSNTAVSSVPAPTGTTVGAASGAAEDNSSLTSNSASGATAESAYRAANPTSVPVTARSSAGDDRAPASADAPATSSVEDAAPQNVAAATVQEGPESQGVAGLGGVARLGSAGSAPSDSAAADTASARTASARAASSDTVTDVAASEPVSNAAGADVATVPPFQAPASSQTSPNQASPSQTASTRTASIGNADPAPSLTADPETTPEASTAPTQAVAATEPPRSQVPSAPRISGLIGASEAAVPDAAPVPAAVERVVVRAKGESWVQVRADDGTTLFTRVLRSGDVYRVPDRGGLTLATGNAGALEILVDGEPAPSLGTFGEVVRNIALDPRRLADGTAIAGRD